MYELDIETGKPKKVCDTCLSNCIDYIRYNDKVYCELCFKKIHERIKREIRLFGFCISI